MKNDDVFTGLALVGLAFAAYQFMRPRTAAVAGTTAMPVRQMPTNTPSSMASQGWASAGAVLGGLLGQAVASAPGDQVIGGSWATQYNPTDASTYFNDPTAYG